MALSPGSLPRSHGVRDGTFCRRYPRLVATELGDDERPLYKTGAIRMTIRPSTLIYRNYGRVRRTLTLEGATAYRDVGPRVIRVLSPDGKIGLVAPTSEDVARIMSELAAEGCREVDPPERIRSRRARRSAVRRFFRLPD